MLETSKERSNTMIGAHSIGVLEEWHTLTHAVELSIQCEIPVQCEPSGTLQN